MSGSEQARLDCAARSVRAGGLVAYPTETVWGLGADARSERALEALRRFKGRSDGAPIAILLAGPAALEAQGFTPSAAVRALAERFWPGPLTLVLPCARRFAKGLARDDGAVGVRCSPHPVAMALAGRVEAIGAGPLTATSLNLSGRAPAETLAEARALCDAPGSDAPLLLSSGIDAGGASPSTVLDLTGERPRVLRWGGLPKEALLPALQEMMPS